MPKAIKARMKRLESERRPQVPFVIFAESDEDLKRQLNELPPMARPAPGCYIVAPPPCPDAETWIKRYGPKKQRALTSVEISWAMSEASDNASSRNQK